MSKFFLHQGSLLGGRHGVPRFMLPSDSVGEESHLPALCGVDLRAFGASNDLFIPWCARTCGWSQRVLQEESEVKRLCLHPLVGIGCCKQPGLRRKRETWVKSFVEKCLNVYHIP